MRSVPRSISTLLGSVAYVGELSMMLQSRWERQTEC
jgi:hypothetical protein